MCLFFLTDLRLSIKYYKLDKECSLEHELTSEPMSLFKNGLMRKTQKSVLRKLVLKEKPVISHELLDSVSILDGGALLHRVRWPKDCTFNDVCWMYFSKIRQFDNPVVIFDGYGKVSTKHQEHLRRNPVPKSSFVNISRENIIPFRQDEYFSSVDNKIAFIEHLMLFLASKNIIARSCSGDADCDIVKEAMNHALKNKKTVVVSDDTDGAVLFLHHWRK